LPSHETLVALLQHSARQQPQKAAFVFLGDGETEAGRLTLSGLDRHARRVGAYLQELGAASSPVLTIYPVGLDFIGAFWACIYAGAIAVPAPPPDQLQRPEKTLQRLQSIVENVRPKIVLTSSQVEGQLKTLLSRTQLFRDLRFVCTDATIEETYADRW
jgi:acyl-CoA synthetase (AMP-forming)/AMP-acid ligase II